MHDRIGAQQSHVLVLVEVARFLDERTVDLQLLSGLGGNGLDVQWELGGRLQTGETPTHP